MLLFCAFPLLVYAKEINLAKLNCDANQASIAQKIQQNSTFEKELKPSKSEIITHKQMLKQMALQNKINLETANLIDDLVFLETVIKLDRNQPENILTFDEYYRKTMPNYKIEDAKKFLKENWNELEIIEQKYKVEKEIIVSLLLVETYFGKVTGKFNIMDAIFSLTLSDRRVKFWENELMSILKLIDKNNTLYNRDTKGSWGGAVGLIQFIPSTFLNFAVDGDGDGKIDIISNKLDAFASAANYLKKLGWKYNAPYLKKTKSITTFNQLCSKAGYPFQDGILVVPDKKLDTEAFIVYNNYLIILGWNRSLFFATTIGIVFNKLKDEKIKS